LSSGGRIDRSQPIEFSFDGKVLRGFAGDSLASALMANGVAVVGRSFKRHRPRGLLSLGLEEPNAIMNLGAGALAQPNRIASETALTQGLDARPTRGWPSVNFDVGAAINLWPAASAAGFYYKTFMGPKLPGAGDAWNRI
jgi:sarcosine oxidase subunit alpha